MRIAYPWQSAKEQVKLALKEAEVGLEKANEDVDAANKLLQEISDALALMKLKKGILKDPIRGSVGVMEGAQFYDVVKAILPLKGNILMSAYARDDTDAAGPLRLKIKVEQ